VLSLGYSRGGALAVEYAATAGDEDLPVPDWVMSVFPAPFGTRSTSSTSARSALHGAADPRRRPGSSRRDGRRRYLGQRLQQGGVPGENIEVEQVASHGAFTADHFAPMSTSPAAKNAFWRPADDVLNSLDQNAG
jgi:acetyl esterase/lipase